VTDALSSKTVVERLRSDYLRMDNGAFDFRELGYLREQAAQEIESLRTELQGTRAKLLRVLIAERDKLRSALKELVEQVDSLDGIELTRDQEPYKAQACWDEALDRAKLALHTGETPCEYCNGTGRLTIYDRALYLGQLCSPIGDEPCYACSPDEDATCPQKTVVERLRDEADWLAQDESAHDLAAISAMRDGADEIERLREQYRIVSNAATEWKARAIKAEGGPLTTAETTGKSK